MNIQDAHHYPEVGVPLFWPFGFAAGLEDAALDTSAKTLEFLGEVEKTQIERPPPEWATENHVRLELHTLSLRDFSRGSGSIPVLVLPPYAGHTSTIADFQEGQSLVATLSDNGCARVFAADWRSATPQMRFYDVDNYLAEINVCVDELGGKVALVGLCQGGWCAAMYAARFSQKIHRLVLAGSPIDTDAGEGAIKEAAHTLPMRFYEGLVHAGGGLMKGAFMLEGFKNMHPATQYFDKFADLYEHIDNPSYVARFEHFERWYEYTINLPGSWYLQVIREIFKENRLANGEFVGLGQRLSLKSITCPAYLLAGARDDITPKEQVFAAEKLMGTPPSEIQKEIAEGGHIGLFMGCKVLQHNWVRIAGWLSEGQYA
jgi:poly(3-hydroxybutyrate) depolymerase